MVIAETCADFACLAPAVQVAIVVMAGLVICLFMWLFFHD